MDTKGLMLVDFLTFIAPLHGGGARVMWETQYVITHARVKLEAAFEGYKNILKQIKPLYTPQQNTKNNIRKITSTWITTFDYLYLPRVQAETFQFLLVIVTCQLQSSGTRGLGPGPQKGPRSGDSPATVPLDSFGGMDGDDICTHNSIYI